MIGLGVPGIAIALAVVIIPSIGKTLDGIARGSTSLSSSEDLSAVSQQLSAAPDENAAQSAKVSAAPEQVSHNVQSVAAGAEELGASIHEIAKNTSDAARVATEAVAVADPTWENPTPRTAGHVGEARMVRFCARISFTGRVPAAVLVERVRTNLLSASDGNVAGHRYAALHLANQLELLNNQLRAYNRRIDELLAQHPDQHIFTSFPAAGRVVAAELLAEIGEDRSRYPTPQVLLAEAGAAPVTLVSGKVQRVHIRWACNRRLRSTTTTWAYVLKRIDPISRGRYQASMERGATFHGALRAVSSSWLRVLCCCWQDGTTYDPTRHRPNN